MARLLLTLILVLNIPGQILFATISESINISNEFEVINDRNFMIHPQTGVIFTQNHKSSILNICFSNGVFFNCKPHYFTNSELLIFGKNSFTKKTTTASEIITNTDLKIFPNPFYDRTTIEFNLNTKTNVELMIYNVLGKEIIHLVSETMEKGNHKLIWEGTDAAGQRIPEGMYLCKLEAEGKTMIKAVYLSKEN